jgi:hypothetical protein
MMQLTDLTDEEGKPSTVEDGRYVKIEREHSREEKGQACTLGPTNMKSIGQEERPPRRQDCLGAKRRARSTGSVLGQKQALSGGWGQQ